MIKLLDVRETITDYRKSTLYLCGYICTLGCKDCFHNELKKNHPTTLSIEKLFTDYISTTSCDAILFSGLNWLEQIEELFVLIHYIRSNHINKDIVIYTGYDKHEISDKIAMLSKFDNIIIKYGRFDATLPPRYDDVLGITLASSNQWAELL